MTGGGPDSRVRPSVGQRPTLDSESSEGQRPRPNREAQWWAEAHGHEGGRAEASEVNSEGIRAEAQCVGGGGGGGGGGPYKLNNERRGPKYRRPKVEGGGPRDRKANKGRGRRAEALQDGDWVETRICLPLQG